jgi:hypothetical protein
MGTPLPSHPPPSFARRPWASKLAPAQPGHGRPRWSHRCARPGDRLFGRGSHGRQSLTDFAERPLEAGQGDGVGTKLAEGADRSTGKVFEAAQERAHYQCHPPGRAGVPGGVGVVRGPLASHERRSWDALA